MMPASSSDGTVLHPMQEHFIRAREWIRRSAPSSLSDADLACSVFKETEDLRAWYQAKTAPPRPRSWRNGYLFAYGALGYGQLDLLARKVPEVGRILGQASTGAVMGCGPCPELWSISRWVRAASVKLSLFDEHLLDWFSTVEHFTRPLVERSLRSGASATVPSFVIGADGIEAFRLIVGRFDFIVAQQSMNEQVYRGPNRSAVLRQWLAEHTKPGGVVIVIERNESRLKSLIERGGVNRECASPIVVSLPGNLSPRQCPGIDWLSEASVSYRPRTRLEMHAAVLFPSKVFAPNR